MRSKAPQGPQFMRLQRMQIRGFKSFADPVELEFPEQITAIVGPNGSGKSNIVDAFRWALGEQSPSKLRCSSMDELIFSGSESRRRLGLARVDAVFDNQDGLASHPAVELAVRRRVDRSGRSDYLINGKKCRLRDVQEVFMDTGLGSGSYAIIGQGEVERILEAEPEQLREYVEEVAGITRYHSVLQTGSRRMHQVSQMRDRLDDMLQVQQAYLMPLRRQAVRARLHRILQSRRDRLQGKLIAARLRESMAAWRRYREEQQECQDNLDSLRQQDSELTRQIKTHRERLSRLNDRERSFVRGCENLREQQSQIKYRLSNLDDRLDSLSTAADRSEKAMADVSQLRQQLGEDSEQKLSDFSDQLEKLNSEISELTSQTDANAARLRRIEGVCRRTEQLLGELGVRKQKASSELRALDERLGRAFTDMSQIKQTIDDAGVTVDDYGEEQSGSIARRIEDLHRRLADLKDRQTTAVAHLKRAQRTQQQLRETKQARQEQLARWQARRETLEEIVSREKGQADEDVQTEQMHAVLSQFEIPQDCEEAVSIALGPWKAALLDDAQPTGAAFPSAGNVKGNYIFSEVMNRTISSFGLQQWRDERIEWEEWLLHHDCGEPVVGWLDEMISLSRPDGRLATIRDYLFGRFLVVEEGSALWQITTEVWAAACRQRQSVPRLSQPLYIVSLTGELADLTGAVRCPTHQEESGDDLVAHWGEIQRLQSAISETAVRVDEVSEQLSSAEEDRRQYQQELECIREQVRECESELQHLQRKRKEQKRKQKRAKDRLQTARSQRDDKAAEIENLQREKASGERKLRRLERARAELSAHRRNWQEKLQKCRDRLQQGTEELEALRERRAAMKERINAKKQQQRDRRNQRQNIQSQLEKWSEELQQIEREKAQIKKQRGQLSRRRTALGEAVKRAEEGRKEVVESRKDAAQRLSGLQKRQQQAQSQISSLQDELSDLKLKATRAKMRAEEAGQDARKELGVEPEKLLQQAQDAHQADYSQLQDRIDRYDGRMEELAPVNPLAIEEYREQRKQFVRLQEHAEDLEASVAVIEEAADRFRRQLSSRFSEAFDQVSDMFGETFADLFGGGQAELRVERGDYDEDVGVHIRVQPPGKRLSRLSLLSGGERALAGIAFLFALLKLQSATVCVLDEIDATLDETNTERFAEYLVRNKGETQYVLITHQKRTMEAADALHGVTMPEDGVSQLVSMRLGEALQQPQQIQKQERGDRADEQPQRAAQR